MTIAEQATETGLEPVLSDADIQQFHEQGFVVVKGALSREEAERYRQRILSLVPPNLDMPDSWSSWDGRIKPMYTPGNHTFDTPELLPLMTNPKLYAAAAQLLQSSAAAGARRLDRHHLAQRRAQGHAAQPDAAHRRVGADDRGRLHLRHRGTAGRRLLLPHRRRARRRWHPHRARAVIASSRRRRARPVVAAGICTATGSRSSTCRARRSPARPATSPCCTT